MSDKKADFQFKNFPEFENLMFDPAKLALDSDCWLFRQLNAYVKGRNGSFPFKVSL